VNKWKVSFFLCLLILIGTNIFWFLVTVDHGITYTYQQVSIEDQKNSISALGKLIIKGADGYGQKDILHLLRQSKPDAFIVEEGNSIIFEGSRFTFKDGKLVDVGPYN